GVSGIARHGRWVIEGEIGLAKGDGVECGIAQLERSEGRLELALVTQDVFDVFDTDVAGTHDLDHGTLRLCGAEQLGEEAETQAFTADGARCGREGLEITSTHGAEPHGGDLARVSLSSVAQFTTMGRRFNDSADIPG